MHQIKVSVDALRTKLKNKKKEDLDTDDESELRHDKDFMQDEDVILHRALKRPEQLLIVDSLKRESKPKFDKYIHQAAEKMQEMEFIGDRVFNLEMSIQLTEGSFNRHKRTLFSIYTSNKLVTTCFMDWGPSKIDVMASDIEVSCALAYLHGDGVFVSNIVKATILFGEMTSEMSASRLDEMENFIQSKERKRHSMTVQPSSSVKKIDLNSGPSPFGLLKNHFLGITPVGESMEQSGVIFECTLKVRTTIGVGRSTNKRTARDNAAMEIMREMELV